MTFAINALMLLAAASLGIAAFAASSGLTVWMLQGRQASKTRGNARDGAGMPGHER